MEKCRKFQSHSTFIALRPTATAAKQRRHKTPEQIFGPRNLRKAKSLARVFPLECDMKRGMVGVKLYIFFFGLACFPHSRKRRVADNIPSFMVLAFTASNVKFHFLVEQSRLLDTYTFMKRRQNTMLVRGFHPILATVSCKRPLHFLFGRSDANH